MKTAGATPDLAAFVRELLPDVLRSFLGFAATELASGDDGAGRIAGEDVQAMVPLAGPRASGGVFLALPRAFAALALERLLAGTATAPPTDAEVRDVVGELCNLLAGRAAARLERAGVPCELGVPEVVLGPARHRAGPAREPHGPAVLARTDWSCQGHRVALEIRLDCRPT